MYRIRVGKILPNYLLNNRSNFPELLLASLFRFITVLKSLSSIILFIKLSHSPPLHILLFPPLFLYSHLFLWISWLSSDDVVIAVGCDGICINGY